MPPTSGGNGSGGVGGGSGDSPSSLMDEDDSMEEDIDHDGEQEVRLVALLNRC